MIEWVALDSSIISPLISATYGVDNALAGFEKNKEKDTLKVLLDFQEKSTRLKVKNTL